MYISHLGKVRNIHGKQRLKNSFTSNSQPNAQKMLKKLVEVRKLVSEEEFFYKYCVILKKYKSLKTLRRQTPSLRLIIKFSSSPFQR